MMLGQSLYTYLRENPIRQQLANAWLPGTSCAHDNTLLYFQILPRVYERPKGHVDAHYTLGLTAFTSLNALDHGIKCDPHHARHLIADQMPYHRKLGLSILVSVTWSLIRRLASRSQLACHGYSNLRYMWMYVISQPCTLILTTISKLQAPYTRKRLTIDYIASPASDIDVSFRRKRGEHIVAIFITSKITGKCHHTDGAHIVNVKIYNPHLHQVFLPHLTIIILMLMNSSFSSNYHIKFPFLDFLSNRRLQCVGPALSEWKHISTFQFLSYFR